MLNWRCFLACLGGGDASRLESCSSSNAKGGEHHDDRQAGPPSPPVLRTTSPSNRPAGNAGDAAAAVDTMGEGLHRMRRALEQPVPHAAAALLLKAHAQQLAQQPSSVTPAASNPSAWARTIGASTTFSFLAASRAGSEPAATLAPHELQELRSARRFMEVCGADTLL
jgi:hypothetical protein